MNNKNNLTAAVSTSALPVEAETRLLIPVSPKPPQEVGGAHPPSPAARYQDVRLGWAVLTYLTA
ncbi:MAG: hypothetical protein HYZ72_09610 [Deltaproteobacteria bacterium]|nr:hypothetical protein [Deltaproteobacteria bacterium]